MIRKPQILSIDFKASSARNKHGTFEMGHELVKASLCQSPQSLCVKKFAKSQEQRMKCE